MSRAFNGTDQYFTLASAAALALPNGDWSLGGWIKIDANAGSYYQFLYNRMEIISDYVQWIIGEESVSGNANKLYFYAADGGYNVGFVSDTAPGQNRNWQHICVVRSGTTYTQYVNGTANGSSSSANLGEISQNADVYFGSRYDLSSVRFFQGSMAEWAKYDFALSAPQIAALVDGECPKVYGPAWYIPMLGGLTEEIGGLTVTNQGSTDAAHPDRMYAQRRRKLLLEACA
jgi:hypothetical protein